VCVCVKKGGGPGGGKEGRKGGGQRYSQIDGTPHLDSQSDQRRIASRGGDRRQPTCVRLPCRLYVIGNIPECTPTRNRRRSNPKIQRRTRNPRRSQPYFVPRSHLPRPLPRPFICTSGTNICTSGTNIRPSGTNIRPSGTNIRPSWYKNICTRGTKIFVPVVQISWAWRVVSTKNIEEIIRLFLFFSAVRHLVPKK
jgi:hypothetical protein